MKFDAASKFHYQIIVQKITIEIVGCNFYWLLVSADWEDDEDHTHVNDADDVASDSQDWTSVTYT